ncbi:biotin--[acetyl-CoA-carboxylase] ligase [Oceanicella actignis]|uniref:biotin--[biotin carboxyl-carrier protein] ligase n=1 Tax=Oceanicella actignis TaxID=1189325 RepID=A0A1M7S089_9RHOB|nr:biotin--[acetyl-CoA-carboxylase] ligase [Oceanicella actignis]SES94468.1 BirA family transcriptional regulator, biotin operon repressor / biotin-[acetyl-CoA-carboxylase] ligase [Oceanicella actignis]SHN51732.1 BirA family transcriptional regulator, biotin operon repressor / biotin-[acetyl-CoA-carboxylase] ligase [Oceanicella actignis]
MNWPEGVGRLILDEIDSTNEEARRRARSRAAAGGWDGRPLWIMARRQLAGRGRRGAPWTAPEGNLNATLLMRPEAPAAQAALLSFAACLAVAELLDAHAPGGRVALKWPNDALLDGGKVAGVLLESEGAGPRLDWLAIGVGVNLAAHPQLPPEARGAFPPTSLRAAGAMAPRPEEALEILAAAFARRAARMAREGFAPIREEWLARAARLGQTIEARLPGRVLRGVFEDVDGEGALVLRTGDGPVRIAAAEVHFP